MVEHIKEEKHFRTSLWWSALEKKKTLQDKLMHNIIFIGTILSLRKKSLTSITYSLHAQLMSEDDEKEISLFNTG